MPWYARPRASDNGAKKRRGRPPGSRNSGASQSRVAKPKANAKSSRMNKSKAKPRTGDEEDELSVGAPTQSRSVQPRKRTSQNEADEITAEPTKLQKHYVPLEVKTKRIPQSIIETWPFLPPQVLEQMSTVIKDAKRDIANTQRDERKIMAAHNSLNPLVKRLVRHLQAARAPPQARDYHFNADKLTERNGHTFRDVTIARHSKQLLSEQVKVTQNLLDKDEKDLDGLRKDAKKWRTEWKHQQRHGRVHPLLRDSEDLDIDDDGPGDIRLKTVAAVDTSTLDAPDTELAPILEQLRRSLENMQGNHTQVEGIGQALTDAQTALDDVLFRHASAQQYHTI
ncbi:hypothetical protein OPT61_g1103 [Boeremia exigua]|uniref:Uncharacterized protein n=1 Tax=Boeremia exigua TaxID=749465 RepID=A0ACC2IRI8_9PLEO|nr:hypothetical protein OPT61_g1103 [Boeremia exigua]